MHRYILKNQRRGRIKCCAKLLRLQQPKTFDPLFLFTPSVMFATIIILYLGRYTPPRKNVQIKYKNEVKEVIQHFNTYTN